jgi:hypothetical protein
MDQLTAPSLLGNKYAALSLNKTDRLRFLQFPEDVYQGAEDVLLRAWPPGIQSVSRYGGARAHEHQLLGRPWGTLGRVESLGSRELLRSVLAYLYDGGWVLTTSIGLSEKPVDWLVVQFSHGDRIFLHGSEAVGLVAGIRGCSSDWASTRRRSGTTTRTRSASRACTPWRQKGEKSMQTRVLLLEMAEELDRQGWQSYGTIHQRSNTDDWKACNS